MAKNDVVLLDGIIDQKLIEDETNPDRGEAFEVFAFEQILKSYDLSRDEIELGWTDGRDDGGIDGFYVFINGHLLEDPNEFAWPRSNAAIEVFLVTCKHHDTFSQASIDSILATLGELFDLGIQTENLRGSYSEGIQTARDGFMRAYRKLSIGSPSLTFDVIYASRGDTTAIGESVAARARQVESVLGNLFSSCSAKFAFVGAAELVSSYRTARTFSLELPFIEHLATGRDSYVLLVRLEEYWKFVSDEHQNLRRYLFDSNVRDYLGKNQVNDDIASSLADRSAPDFWWLNNGVTILATRATVPGKSIQLQDIQIVNGLQTTETIFSHFQSGELTSLDRCILVKIIVSSDETVRDRIIRATNNQSQVEISALHATDKIQRDIEEILERSDWYYERRKNYYRNIGKPQARFVTPAYLASAVVALIFKHPVKATKLKTRFMRNPDSYRAIFSDHYPIEVWPVLVGIYKYVDLGLANLAPSRHHAGERFNATWRAVVALIATARILGTFAYPIDRLRGISPQSIDQKQIDEIWAVISETSNMFERARVSSSFAVECCRAAAATFNLLGKEDVAKRELPVSDRAPVPASPALPAEFIEMVDTLLPEQPWKPGVHLDVASKLDCSKTKVTRAIQELIASGKRRNQQDGVVYDADGEVLATDPERVPQEAVPK